LSRPGLQNCHGRHRSGPDAERLAQNQSFGATLEDVGACRIRIAEHSKPARKRGSSIERRPS
jgi:hypothetical protein